MRRLLLLTAAVALGRGADNPEQILTRIAQNVAIQIAKAQNYTCVETVDRSYFVSKWPMRPGCSSPMSKTNWKHFMHDRLRLDIAVSKDGEMYSWHAEKKFGSGRLSEIVRNGPISSGNFVGYLYNIFMDKGTHFSFAGISKHDGIEVYNFKYNVPLASSRYHVQFRNKDPLVPFHGSFSASTADYHVTSLEVIGDGTAEVSDLCLVDTDLKYQVINISGHPSLIPSDFELRIDTASHLSTISRSEYNECREFRGESTLLFHPADASAAAAAGDPAAAEASLPAGLTMKIGLQTRIDDRKSFTGDPVDGILLEPVPIPGTQTVLPKGAVLHGVIVQLEHRYEPWSYYFLNIRFEHLSYANHSFRLVALPKTSKKSYEELYETYDNRLPPEIAAIADRGIFAIGSSHLRLNNRFFGVWRTIARPANP